MTDPAAPLTTRPLRSYWQIVMDQFCRNRWAVGGLVLVGIFFTIALFAPFLALNKPFFWIEDGAVSFPFFREYFAPADTTEPLLTAFFNYVLLLLVPVLLVLRLAPRSARRLLLVTVALLLLIPFWSVSPRNMPQNFRILRQEGKGRGWMPLIPYGANEVGFGALVAPSWYFGSSEVGQDHIRFWGLFAEAIVGAEGTSTPLGRIAGALPEAEMALLREVGVELEVDPDVELALRDTRQRLIETPPGEERTLLETQLREVEAAYEAEEERIGETREKVILALNRILLEEEVFGPADLDALVLPDEAWEFLAAERLLPRQRQRLQHMALQATLRRAMIEVPFPRRKFEDDKPGYHLLGTDLVGRDVLVRMIHGARVSLAVGFVSVGLATLIGLVLGAMAGYFGGWTDILISRLIEIMMCFPSFFLILTLIAVMEKRSILNIMVVIGVTGWTGTARLIRGEVLKQKRLDYVASAQALGATSSRIIFRHILPNAIAPVLVAVSFGIAGAILTESGLSFIGFGVAAPTATWGELLSQGRNGPLINWWLVVFPGILIFLSVTAYNLVGEGLRDAMDPRLKR